MKSFISEAAHGKEIIDTVFEAASGAISAIKKHGDDAVVNGAFGTYFKEDKAFLTFDSVYKVFDAVDHVQKAKYASSIAGPPEFQKAVKDWLFKSADLDIDADVIATPGGTGALSSTTKNALAPGESVVHPDIGWGPYKTIAKENNTPVEYYKLFDGNAFNLESFKETCTKVMKSQGKVLAFINDPCQNPTGYTMSDREWDDVLAFVNELSEQGPFILLHDIAYIDFNKQGDDYKKIFKKFTQLNENVLTVIAFSVSKTLTAYGWRVGAQVLISNNDKGKKAFKHACGNAARGGWSTVNNGGMVAFSDIALNEENKTMYLKEKNNYVHLLQERAEIMVKESEEIGLPLYPYHEGFFITIRIDDQIVKNELHLKLKNHNIFFVNVFGGLRVAICSIPKAKLRGLAKRVKDVLDTIVDDEMDPLNDDKTIDEKDNATG